MKKVLSKLKIYLTNNIGLKLLALFIAVILWLVIVNINDPVKTTTIYNIPVTVTDEGVLEDENMVYSVDESLLYVNVTISGKRSVLNDLNKDDFKATASLKELSVVNAVPVEVAVVSTSVAKQIDILDQSVQTITVSTEEKVEKEFDLEIQYEGSTAEGYVTNEYALAQETVTVYAPKSVMEKITKACVVCDLDNAYEDIEKNCKIVLYDSDGNKIKGANIEKSVKRVKVYVQVLTFKNVPVVVEYTGDPAEGCEVGEVTVSSDSVDVCGEGTNYINLSEILISEGVDISDADSDMEFTINLADYLPDNVYVIGESALTVTVEILNYETVSLAIDTSDINIQNLTDGYSAKFAKSLVTVKLRGEAEIVEAITTDTLSPSVDAGGLETGRSYVTLNLNLPEGVTLLKEKTLVLVISE